MMNSVEEQSARNQGQILDLALDNAVLVMGPDRAERYFLVAFPDRVLKAFVHEASVVGAIGCNVDSSISSEAFKRRLSKQGLVEQKVAHERDMDIISEVVHKYCGAPDPHVCEESAHLGYQPGLS